MPYRVTAPEVSILRDLNVYKDEKGEVTGYDRDSVIYLQGDIVPDEHVSKVVKDSYEAGDPHIRGLIEYVDAEVEPEGEAEHDVNQDLNLSDPEPPKEEKEFKTVQFEEDGPQEFKPNEGADAVEADAPKVEVETQSTADEKSAETEEKPKAKRKTRKKAEKSE